MILANLTNPAKLAALYSHLVFTRRKFWSQANNRSIFHLLRYRLSSRPSCVLGFTRPFRCGAISRTLRFRNRSSSLSLSYALSATTLLGFGRTKRLSRVRSANFVSWIEAVSIHRAIGRPLRSAIAMILVPFPRFVGPTHRPPFLLLRRSHPGSILRGLFSLAFGGLRPEISGACP